MAGVTVSFVADPAMAARIKDIARSDGVTPSQATARAASLGVLLPASARRLLRLILTEGDEETRAVLRDQVAKAIGQVGNAMLEARLLKHAGDLGLGADESEEDLAEQAVRAVADYRRQQSASERPEPEPVAGLGR